ncbi:hypothetical protein Taro_056996 [Colocasia esculenta]|uniref:Uncharacterized protein n=1 Tax=Colocasia esculenta TaxID=4460 RepID=A0A843XXA6_COLES|nr:hypothetical protein [Colocasia esculenta]
MGLLTFSAAAVIAAKSTTFAKQPGSGGQQDSQRGFFFCASVGLWFTSLLFSMFIILVNTFKEGSKGLVINSKIFNSSGICIAVVGVAFWIFA